MKGMTYKACEGCGSTNGRRIGDVCRGCRELLAEARATRAAQAAVVDAVPMLVPAGDWPYLNVPSLEQAPREYRQAIQYRLADALVTVCARLWQVVPGTIAHGLMPVDPTSRHGWRVSVPYLLDTDYQASNRHRTKSALIDPTAAAAIQALDAVIREAIKHAYAKGQADGSNLLGQLAAGSISAEDFNKKTALGDPRATVPRRVYGEDA